MIELHFPNKNFTFYLTEDEKKFGGTWEIADRNKLNIYEEVFLTLSSNIGEISYEDLNGLIKETGIKELGKQIQNYNGLLLWDIDSFFWLERDIRRKSFSIVVQNEGDKHPGKYVGRFMNEKLKKTNTLLGIIQFNYQNVMIQKPKHF